MKTEKSKNTERENSQIVKPIIFFHLITWKHKISMKFIQNLITRTKQNDLKKL